MVAADSGGAEAPSPAPATATAAQAAPAAVAAAPAPSAPAGEEPPAVFERGGWRFEADARPLWQSNHIDDFARDEHLCKVPDMFCGDAALRISHTASKTTLELSAADALRCCRWRPRPGPGLCPDRTSLGLQEDGRDVDGPPLGAVRCQFADRWKPRGDHPDVKALEVTSDWTCSTPYWGSFSASSAGSSACGGVDAERHDGEANGLEEATDEPLPMDLLRRRDEIHWYQEVLFWEDELDDNGICRASVRVRVMPTFWFALLLCELRVDNVLFREVATRFFHVFGSDHVLREWTWKETSYEALRKRGVKLVDNPQISHTSVGTALLDQGDVQQQLRHRLRLRRGGPEEQKAQQAHEAGQVGT